MSDASDLDIDTIELECLERMERSVEYLARELRGLRTGRANTALLEYVKVDYYGSSTDMRELAAISVSESTQLLVKPFDPGAKHEIVKAIERSGLGLNPQLEGSVIRINVPSPSADRRKQLAAQVRKLGEESKIAVRNERRDANKLIDRLAADKQSGVSEDDAKRAKTRIDDLTKSSTERIDDLSQRKVAEIEEI
jgi:ribosome recycling factor